MSEMRIAYCPFCKNSVMVDINDAYIEHEEGNAGERNCCDEYLQEEAVKICTCPGAMEERRIRAQKELAIANIEEMVCQEYPESGALLIAAVELIQREGVRNITLVTEDNTKLSLRQKSDGILVKKQKTKLEEVLT